MPGWSNADNKFGLTPYIVGTTLGDGCNYTSIQLAINDANVAGGGVVGIRPGTYVEDLTLQPGVELYGFDVDGRLPSALSKVVIQGNHTLTVTGGFGAQLSQYINFTSVIGDTFTVNSILGGQAILAMKFCGIEASTVAGQRACVLNADNTSAAQFSTDNTNIFSDSHCFESIGLGSHAAALSLGVTGSNTGDVFRHSSGSASLNFSYHNSNANVNIFNGVATNGNCFWEFSRINCGQEAILFSAGASQAQVFNCMIGSGAASNFWIDGLNGQLDFVNVGFTASIIDIGPTITQSKRNWQPYGEAAAVALNSNRGTASFDSASFTVTDGWVQIAGGAAAGSFVTDAGTATPVAGVLNVLGGPGVTTTAVGNTININSVIWSNAIGPTLVVPDSGTFDVVGTTITLPAAPVQGEECRIISVASPTVIQASGTQTIQLGNQISSAGGTATGTDVGDSVVLVYFAAFDRWYAAGGFTGNWVLA